MLEGNRIIREFLTATVAAGATTALAGAMTLSSLDFNVTTGHGARFAGYDPPMLVKCGSELMLVTRTSDAFTVEPGGRGVLATQASSHPSSTALTLATVADIFGGRIYSDRLPDKYANAQPAILFSIRGGAGADSRLPVTTLSVEFAVYGGTANNFDVITASRVLHDRMQHTTNKTVSSGCILSITQEAPFQVEPEPDTEWPRTWAAYKFQLRSA